ncbi:MAG: AMP-binding protein [Candidatus Eremiobacteraeota bacterium]|nr:AMP-binding protein [Candidatus Eremiobacteraeota bacterium]
MSYNHYLFGEFRESQVPLSISDLKDITASAERQLGRIQDVPIEKIVEILDLLAENWLDPEYKYRILALEKMPEIVGLSRQMTTIAIDSLFDNMRRQSLQKILRGHLGKFSFLDKFEYNPTYDGYFKAQPLGIVLHVSPGNVFVGGPDSLMYGFLSKNVNLLKISSRDTFFPFLFAKSLQEIDEGKYLCNSFSILQYSGGDEDIEREMKKFCDGIVVIGGEEAVKSYRRDLPLGTKLIEYGPKYSFSIITAEGFNETDEEEIYKRCAVDVAMWEQKACSSPQTIYVEKSVIGRFMEGFPRYMELVGDKLPRGDISFDERVEILRARELAKADEAEGVAALHQSPQSTRWTVIYEDSPEFKLSPLNRTIYVKPFASWAEILRETVMLKDYLQSVGILSTSSQLKLLSKALARLGVSRITRIGTMWKGKSGAPHDFDFPLRKLIRWVSIDWIDKRFDLGDTVAPAKPALSRWDRLHNMVRFARTHSDFYRKQLAGIGEIHNYEDFQKVPLLTKHHIYKNTPPTGEGMLTTHLSKAYIFASGGSTGEPKFNYYSFRELDRVSSILADIYQIAGITRDDTVANLFMAGFLWTSFIVVNDALEKIGCVSLPIAGNAEINLILRYMELFKPNAVVGLPSMIIQLAEEIERRGLDIKIEKILYGGEHLSPEAIKYLKETVGARVIQSAGYASVDAGPIGYQCPECRGGVHHLLYGHMFIETIDSESERSVEIDEVGEIVVTNFHRRLMPIIRYRTGDLGRILSRSCTCIHQTPLFELLGRCDDILRVGAMSIYPNMISEALGKVSELSTTFQLEADYRGVKDILTVRVEVKKEGGDSKKLADITRRTLLEHDEELDLVVREGWLAELNIEILPPGGIKRNPRTGKIKRVLDKRRQGTENG